MTGSPKYIFSSAPIPYQTISTLEDQPVAINLLTQDADLDTIKVFMTGAEGGDVFDMSGKKLAFCDFGRSHRVNENICSESLVVNGAITYHPFTDVHGPFRLQYVLDDGYSSANYSLEVQVLSVNDLPVLQGDQDVDAHLIPSAEYHLFGYTFDVAAGFDADASDALDYSVVTVPRNGQLYEHSEECVQQLASQNLALESQSNIADAHAELGYLSTESGWDEAELGPMPQTNASNLDSSESLFQSQGSANLLVPVLDYDYYNVLGNHELGSCRALRQGDTFSHGSLKLIYVQNSPGIDAEDQFWYITSHMDEFSYRVTDGNSGACVGSCQSSSPYYSPPSAVQIHLKHNNSRSFGIHPYDVFGHAHPYDVFGHAVEIEDGNDSLIELSLHNGNTLSGELTLEFYARTTAAPLNNLVLAQGLFNSTALFEVKLTRSGLLSVSAGSGTALDTSISFNDGFWHHVSVSRNHLNSYTFLLDGHQIHEQKGSNSEATDIDKFVLFQGLAGEVDEVSVWNTFRSRDEIVASMSNLFHGSESGLYAYFPMENYTEGALFDLIADASLSETMQGRCFKCDHVHSDAPLSQTIQLALQYNRGDLVEITLPGFGDLFIVTRIPQIGTLYDREIMAVIKDVPFTLTGSKLKYEAKDYDPLQTTAAERSLQYTVSNSSDSAAAIKDFRTLSLEATPNPSRPVHYADGTPLAFSVALGESLNLRLVVSDADLPDDTVDIFLTTLPSIGALYHYSEANTLTPIGAMAPLNVSTDGTLVEAQIVFVSDSTTAGTSTFGYIAKDKHGLETEEKLITLTTGSSFTGAQGSTGAIEGAEALANSLSLLTVDLYNSLQSPPPQVREVSVSQSTSVRNEGFAISIGTVEDQVQGVDLIVTTLPEGGDLYKYELHSEDGSYVIGDKVEAPGTKVNQGGNSSASLFFKPGEMTGLELQAVFGYVGFDGNRTSKEAIVTIDVDQSSAGSLETIEIGDSTPKPVTPSHTGCSPGYGMHVNWDFAIMGVYGNAQVFQVGEDGSMGEEVTTFPTKIASSENKIMVVDDLDSVARTGSMGALGSPNAWADYIQYPHPLSPYEWNKETPSGQNSEISYACLNADGDYTTLNLINVTTVPVDEAPVLSSEENPALHTEFLSDKYIGAVNQYSIADVLFSIFMESTDPEKDEPTYIVTELPVSGLSTDTGVRIDRVGQEISDTSRLFTAFSTSGLVEDRFSYTAKDASSTAINSPETTVVLNTGAGILPDVAGDAGYAPLFESEIGHLRATITPTSFSEFTFGMWANIMNAFSSTRDVMLAEIPGVFELNVTRVGNLVLKVHDSSGQSSVLKESLEGYSINDKAWHFIAVALEHRILKEDNIATVKVFIDGNEVASQIVFLTSLKVDPNLLVIGTHLIGMVDEISLWNRFMSSAHTFMRSSYKWSLTGTLPLQGDEEGLLLYYRFNDALSITSSANDVISDLTGKSTMVASGVSFVPSNAPVGDFIDLDEDSVASYILQGSASTISVTTLPKKGRLLTSNGIAIDASNTVLGGPNFEVTYIPDSNADGVDSFGYVSGASSEAVVSINIKPVNDPPRISFVSRNLNISSISEDLVIKLLGTDEDGLAPSPVVCALPIYGTLYQYDGKIISSVPTEVVDEEGRVLYTPPANDHFESQDRLAFKFSDGVLQSKEIPVFISILSDKAKEIKSGDSLDFTAISLDESKSYTVEMWVKVLTDTVQFRRNLAAYKFSAANNLGQTYVDFSTEDDVSSLLQAVEAVMDKGMTKPIDTQDSSWHHIAATYDKISNIKKVYVDGALDLSQSISVSSGSKNVVIGARTYVTQVLTKYFESFENIGSAFNGYLDDLAIWSYAKDMKEVRESMNAAVTGNEAGLVYYDNFQNEVGAVPLSVPVVGKGGFALQTSLGKYFQVDGSLYSLAGGLSSSTWFRTSSSNLEYTCLICRGSLLGEWASRECGACSGREMVLDSTSWLTQVRIP